MNFSEYQEKAVATAIYPEIHKIMYPTLGLTNEAGEVAGKVKKVYRDEDGIFSPTALATISAEIGDVLWYMAALCRDLGINLQDVAAHNLTKLAARSERGTLKGSGDDR